MTEVPKIITAWRCAFECTIASSCIDESDRAILEGRLKVLLMQLNPHAMMMEESIERAMDTLEQQELREFFLRLTARFSASMCVYGIDFNDIVRDAYVATNINFASVTTASNSLLGEENVEQHYSIEEGMAVLHGNRWYTTLIYFALFSNGLQYS